MKLKKLIFSLLILGHSVLSMAGGEQSVGAAVFNAKGELLLPKDFQQWIFGYTDLMVDGAPSPHQSDTTLRWLID